ncbi:hypothetical protein IEN85_05820 [Pelagicoccus sp. NFK12]|uniref:Uncharacterized protein n=1 Tax=Pelagicoccus enzymogenes TaxID=2773457 RepID=A0A927F6A5_9BACT|nr:hypothetical protein [Pelagicoccus enzymogenes]MBD5779002.1 hypothetical protein [Pelagicoccus enzymogenes]
MNYSIDDKKPLRTKIAQRCVALATGLTLLTASIASPEGHESNETQALQVYFDDLEGATYTDISNARDDLLHNAFADAADRKEWIGEFDIEYNTLPDEDESGYLMFTVIDWERSRSNFYSFSARAEYVDNDGVTHDLGVVRGQNSGISVSTPRDAGEMFSEVAETAIKRALESLEDKLEIS